jgi:hypothetical protein
MNALRNQLLHEVAHLDIKSLLILQSIVTTLKKSPTDHYQKGGEGAARCRKTLADQKIV